MALLSSSLPLRIQRGNEGPTTPEDLRPSGLGSSPFARHYSGNTYWYLFLRVLRWFTSPGSPPKWLRTFVRGLPHSGILGSQLACSSPRLIAACHALHRPKAPRHPPHTFTILTRISPSCHRPCEEMGFRPKTLCCLSAGENFISMTAERGQERRPKPAFSPERR